MTKTKYTSSDLHPIPHLPEKGIPLLRAVWEQIKADTSAWNQNTWVGQKNVHEGLDRVVIDYIKTHKAPPWNCGTAYCVAGHVALAKGATLPPAVVSAVEIEGQISTSRIVPPGVETTMDDPDYWSKVVDVDEYANQVLGLRDHQGVELFSGSNSGWEIEQMVLALENDPTAALAEAVYAAKGTTTRAEIREWEYANGFKVRPPLSALIRNEVEDEYPYQNNSTNKLYTFLVLTGTSGGAELTAHDVHHALLADEPWYSDEDDYDDYPPSELSDCTTEYQETALKIAIVLNNIARRVGL